MGGGQVMRLRRKKVNQCEKNKKKRSVSSRFTRKIKSKRKE